MTFFCVDDRAILFEKQRLRLRRTLQNLAPPPLESENEPVSNHVKVDVKTTKGSPKKGKNSHDMVSKQQKYALRSTSTSPKPTSFMSVSNANSPSRHGGDDHHGIDRMHIGELGGDIDSYRDDDSAVSSLMTSQSKKKSGKKKSNLPTYAWELAAEESNPRHGEGRVGQERIFTAEHGSFVPSSTPGIYMAEDTSDDTSTAGSETTDPLQSEKSISGYPSTHLDIQVWSA